MLSITAIHHLEHNSHRYFWGRKCLKNAQKITPRNETAEIYPSDHTMQKKVHLQSAYPFQILANFVSTSKSNHYSSLYHRLFSASNSTSTP
jgi:hypothetical protein